MTYANLYLSYLDETKTLRNVVFDKKEINEIVADAIKNNKNLVVLDVNKIKDNPEVVAELLDNALIRYAFGNRE